MFHELFSGNETRFLTYNPSSLVTRENGKKVPKYSTIARAPTDKEWRQHLAGKQSIGLSPLRDGKCRWGAIDVDLYPLPTSDEWLNGLHWYFEDPCLVARSKSGGIHVIVFAEDWVDAGVMQKYLAAKRDAVFKDDYLAAAQEIFPKQSQGDGSQMNLPCFGDERQVLSWSNGTQIVLGDVDWERVAAECRVSVERMTATKRAPARKKPRSPDFKRPTEGKAMEGRNTYLYHCGASARARGADADQIEEIVHGLVEELSDPSHVLYQAEALTTKEIATVIAQVKKLPKGEPRDLPIDVVNEMNAEWALMFIEGKTEVYEIATRTSYPLADFRNRMLPRKIKVGDKRVPIAELWLHDPDRSEYVNFVLEPLSYNGAGWNMFEGWAVEPEDGDASLWVDYIERIVCGGNAELAHWIMTFIADGVQRPWSIHPGTALALRGPQGGGKSFLGNMIIRIVGDRQVIEVADSDRLFAQFNRDLFGKTFVLAEESVFAGSKQQAAKLKGFVMSPRWTYEQKHLSTFSGKNVHRVIATTNDDQAVHIDADDRRWTVVDVEPVFGDPLSDEAWQAWQPYYDLSPGVVLRYLLDYEVDRDLIRRPCNTAAKSEDKQSSDPLLDLFDEIAETGIIPDDTEARGVIANGVLRREYHARAGSRHDTPARINAKARAILGLTRSERTSQRALHIIEFMRDGDFRLPVYERGKCAKGIDLGDFADFQCRVQKRTGKKYEPGEWRPCPIDQPRLPGENVQGASDEETDYIDKLHQERVAVRVGDLDVPF